MTSTVLKFEIIINNNKKKKVKNNNKKQTTKHWENIFIAQQLTRDY